MRLVIPIMSSVECPQPTPEAVLTKAVLSASKQLGLKPVELGAMLGMHRTAISRLKQCPSLDPQTKAGELALLVVRVALALHTLTGGDREWMEHFIRTPNKITGGVPAKQMETIHGLANVLQCVDAICGKVG